MLSVEVSYDTYRHPKTKSPYWNQFCEEVKDQLVAAAKYPDSAAARTLADTILKYCPFYECECGLVTDTNLQGVPDGWGMCQLFPGEKRACKQQLVVDSGRFAALKAFWGKPLFQLPSEETQQAAAAVALSDRILRRGIFEEILVSAFKMEPSYDNQEEQDTYKRIPGSKDRYDHILLGLFDNWLKLHGSPAARK